MSNHKWSNFVNGDRNLAKTGPNGAKIWLLVNLICRPFWLSEVFSCTEYFNNILWQVSEVTNYKIIIHTLFTTNVLFWGPGNTFSNFGLQKFQKFVILFLFFFVLTFWLSPSSTSIIDPSPIVPSLSSASFIFLPVREYFFFSTFCSCQRCWCIPTSFSFPSCSLLLLSYHFIFWKKARSSSSILVRRSNITVFRSFQSCWFIPCAFFLSFHSACGSCVC